VITDSFHVQLAVLTVISKLYRSSIDPIPGAVRLAGVCVCVCVCVCFPNFVMLAKVAIIHKMI
jgi:hypothetical protein